MRPTAPALLLAAMLALTASSAPAQTAAESVPDPASTQPNLLEDPAAVLENATQPEKVSSTLQILLVLTVLSLAPSILVMMTCFTRIIVVLGLLRQAMATQQLPPNQVLIGLALFMTFVVMAPVYNQVHSEAIGPYMAGEEGVTLNVALGRATVRMREFMIRQIEAGSNEDDVYLFLDVDLAAKEDLTWGDVPTMTLIPAYMVSELKIAFLLGFRIYLPFLIIDMVIASVLISMGMLMLPPVLISLPFKLLLFVLSDGWRLVVSTLMTSFS